MGSQGCRVRGNMKKITYFAALALAAMYATTAGAVTCAPTDVTYDGSNPDSCDFGSGNDPGTFDDFGTGTWEYLAKQNTPGESKSNDVLGVKWTVSGATGTVDGVLTFLGGRYRPARLAFDHGPRGPA